MAYWLLAKSIRRIYVDGFGVRRAWTFHEAADVEQFHPLHRRKEVDVIWIGNWGDEERTAELEEFLIRTGQGTAGIAHGGAWRALSGQRSAKARCGQHWLSRLSAEYFFAGGLC